MLVGERTRRVYRLGDELEVRVVSVNLDDRQIDFELADGTLSNKRGKGSSARRGEDTGLKRSRGSQARTEQAVKQNAAGSIRERLRRGDVPEGEGKSKAGKGKSGKAEGKKRPASEKKEKKKSGKRKPKSRAAKRVAAKASSSGAKKKSKKRSK
mgnify:FL=1